MKAVILSAGKGTRLGKISKRLPKTMVRINGKPLLLYHIENLNKYKINNVYINLHHKPKVITDYFKDGKKFGVNITYSYEKVLLGTGGALVPLKKYLTDFTLVIYGDVIMFVDYKKLFHFHKTNNADVTAVVHMSTHPKDSDLVQFDNKYLLNKIYLKPHVKIFRNSYNLAALYLFNKDVFKYLPKNLPFDIAHDFLPLLHKKGVRIFCYNSDEFIMDIGTPERLNRAKKILKS